MINQVLTEAKFEDLLQLYEQQQKIDNCSAAGMYAARRLVPSFAGFVVPEITPLRIQEHILRRTKAGANNGTINRELAALGRMFSLGQRYELVERVPFIPKLKESPARRGFIEPQQMPALLTSIQEDVVREIVEFLALSGWRKNEALRLEWSHVNETEVWLDPAHSKNGETRLLPLEGRLKTIIEQRRAKRSGPMVFHRQGQRIWEFRTEWKRAIKAACMPGLLVHDLRRSAVRNLINAGVPERVAMKITGHKTRAVFDRYHIVNDSDIRTALRRVV